MSSLGSWQRPRDHIQFVARYNILRLATHTRGTLDPCTLDDSDSYLPSGRVAVGTART